MIYDDYLNITWLQNTNLAAGSIYDNGFSTTDGMMNWDSANDWAEALEYEGYDDWRLPITPVEVEGYDIISSEMGYMYYVNLENAVTDNVRTIPNATFTDGWGNEVSFLNLQPQKYWSGTEYTILPPDAWDFDFGTGYQHFDYKGMALYGPSYGAWAVRPGDVPDTRPVPEPATLLLLASGVVGLVGLRRKFRK